LLNASLFRTAAATVVAGAASAAFAARMAVIRAVTLAWAAAQWVLNAALLANPIVLIITVIIALAAALVIAYKRSETFRNIVNAAFRVVGMAALWMWNNAIKPSLGFIWNLLKI